MAYACLNVFSLLSSVLPLHMKPETTSTLLVLYSTEDLFSTYGVLPLLSFVITASFSQSKFNAFSLSSPFPPQSKIQFGTSMI